MKVPTGTLFNVEGVNEKSRTSTVVTIADSVVNVTVGGPVSADAVAVAV